MDMVTRLASQAHDAWRLSRWTGESYTPRVKQVQDAAWIESHGGVTTCDIANTAFVDLPAEWQAENRDGAEVTLRLVQGWVQAGGELDELFVEAASSTVHTRWMKRNPGADSRLMVAYSDLSAYERSLDRVFVQRAVALVLSEEE